MVKVTMSGNNGSGAIEYYLDTTLSQAIYWVNRAAAGGQACVKGYIDQAKTQEVIVNLANAVGLQEV